MSGESDLDQLLALLKPSLLAGEYVFCSMNQTPFADLEKLHPLALFREDEGMSVLLPIGKAESAGMDYEFVCRGITLSVHSSLDAVGLTAAVSSRLADHGIPANIIAACYHDHVFVPTDRAEEALRLLTEFEA